MHVQQTLTLRHICSQEESRWLVTNGYVLPQPPRNTVLIHEPHIPLAHLEDTLEGEYVTSVVYVCTIYCFITLWKRGPLTENSCVALFYVYFQLPIQRVLGFRTPEVKRLGREADSTSLSHAAIEDGYSYTLARSVCLHGMHRRDFRTVMQLAELVILGADCSSHFNCYVAKNVTYLLLHSVYFAEFSGVAGTL